MSRLSRYFLVFCLFVAVTPFRSFGQDDKNKAKVLLYKDRIAAKWDTVNCVKNAIKINPLLFLRGEVPIYYERALTQRLSAEVALGFTYRNYLNVTFAGDDADAFSAGTKILANPSFHVGFRYYFKDELEPDGPYMQVEFAYLKYSKDITEKDSTGAFTDRTNRDERTFNDVRLYYGFQRISATNNWLMDIYAGVALRTRQMLIVHENLDLGKDEWTYEVEKKNDVVPAFFLGIKVGLGW
jgi:hypothetical protein